MNSIDFVRLVSVLVTLLASTDVALAQETFRACRVPEVGVIYMIGVGDAPAACLDPGHVEFGWIEGGPLGTASVGTAQLANESVTTVKIAPGAVQSTHIASSAVTSVKIANGAVVAGKVADNAIATASIVDGSITTEKIADGTIGAADIAQGAITGVHVVDGSIGFADLGAHSVSATQIVPGAIGSPEVGDGSLTADDLGFASVGSSELALEVVSVIESAPRASPAIGAIALCTNGKTPIAGGHRWTSYVIADVADAALQLSHPWEGGPGWIVSFRDPAPYGILGLEVYVVCVRA
jgi:hypothetical protein